MPIGCSFKSCWLRGMARVIWTSHIAKKKNKCNFTLLLTLNEKLPYNVNTQSKSTLKFSFALNKIKLDSYIIILFLTSTAVPKIYEVIPTTIEGTSNSPQRTSMFLRTNFFLCIYLVPVTDFPLRTLAKVTGCYRLWFASLVTFVSSSTAVNNALPSPSSTGHRAL